MVTLYCSNKLREFLGSSYFAPQEAASPHPMGDWNVQLFYHDRKKNLLMVNNKSYYALVFEGIRKDDFKQLEDLFFSRLLTQLLYDEVIQKDDIPRILNHWGSVQLARTNNDRKVLGTINEFQLQYTLHKEAARFDGRPLLHINHCINTTPTGAAREGRRDYGHPIRDMKALIQAEMNG